MKTKSPPWWNKWCKAAVQKRKAAFRRYRRAANRRNYTAFSKARAEARRQVKSSKRTSWSKFINSINSKTKIRDVWKKINLLNNKYKSEMVSTLILNKKEVKISNVPVVCSPKLIEELCSIGCVQTLRSERENDTTTIIHVRFETEEATGKAMEINGQEVHAHILKAELIVHDNQGQPNVLDEGLKQEAVLRGQEVSFIHLI